MRKFTIGQRVIVRAVGEYDRIALDPPAVGTVRRLRSCDDGAFVDLDARHANDAAHPFPADDAGRSTSVLAYPDDCEPCKTAPADSRGEG